MYFPDIKAANDDRNVSVFRFCKFFTFHQHEINNHTNSVGMNLWGFISDPAAIFLAFGTAFVESYFIFSLQNVWLRLLNHQVLF